MKITRGDRIMFQADLLEEIGCKPVIRRTLCKACNTILSMNSTKLVIRKNKTFELICRNCKSVLRCGDVVVNKDSNMDKPEKLEDMLMYR